MDEELRQLEQKLRLQYEEILRHRSNALERTKAINHFLILCQSLPGLGRADNLAYADALNRTWIRFVKKIDKGEFNPNPDSFLQSLLNWIKSDIRYRIIDGIKENNPGWFSLDNRVRNEEDSSTYLEQLPDTNLSGLEQLIELEQQRKINRFALEVKRYIEEDPEGKLKNCTPRGYPQCNCQQVSQRRLLKEPPITWQDIANEFNIPFGSLTPYWSRKCKPLLQKIALEIVQHLGYKV